MHTRGGTSFQDWRKTAGGNPSSGTLNLEAFKNIRLGDLSLQLFARVFNLLDSKDPTTVYGDTGKPDFTLVEQQVTSYDPGWFTDPTYYSEPRSFFIGTKISL